MAYNSRRINPLDLQPRKAVGVALPFSGAAVFNSTYQTKDAIKTNIINYFLTGQKERYLNPTFGTQIRSLLFENIDDEMISNLKATVREGLSVYFPSIQTTELRIGSTPDTNTVTLSLKYAIKDTNIQDEVVINFEQ